MKKKYKKLLSRIKNIIIVISLFLFVIAIYSIINDWILDNKWIILIISGIILTVFLIFGIIKFKKIKKFIANFLGL
jgi:magnesium-transporting ATPase (P-type)